VYNILVYNRYEAYMKPNDCVFFQIAKAHQAAMRFLSERMAPYGLTVVQSMVLAFLSDADGTTSADLGARTQLDSATLTGVIDRLEAAGHVRRAKHPSDRRAVMLRLTDSGADTAARVRAEIEKANREFFKAAGIADESGLRRALAGIRGGVSWEVQHG